MKIKLDENGIMPTREHDDYFYNMTCPICGKKFHLKPSKINKSKHHYCSIECHKIAKKEYMKGSKNHQYGLKGKDNASWKSDVKESKYGYIQVRSLDHPFKTKDDFVFEHRLVAEKYLLNEENSVEINGRRHLKPEYEVHHKNFDRKDNRVENLEVMTKKDHNLLHRKLNPNNERDELGRFVKSKQTIVKIKKVTETAIMPEKKTDEAAGYDMYVDIQKPVVIKPHCTELIYSGVAFEFPKGYYGLIFARSGLSTKMGIRPSTCVSVIDGDFRGNVGLPLHNDSENEVVINPGDRVAQIIFRKALVVSLELVDELEETERGSNGFGSTGR